MLKAYNDSVWLWRTKRILLSPLKTIRFLDDTAQPDAEAVFRYRGGHFVCRKQDWFGVSEIFLNNEYASVIDCISGVSSPTVVDLGANIGAFALNVFENFPAAKVASVEAAPDTYEILRRNQEINSERNWKVVQAAVWTKNGHVNLDRRGASTGHRIAIDGSDGESIPARRLDDILTEAGIADIDLMKMDIEGAESAVVPVIESIFGRTKILVIEIHTDRIDPSAVYTILARCFSHCWKQTGRNVQKPVLILAHKDMPISEAVPFSLKEKFDLPSEQRGDD